MGALDEFLQALDEAMNPHQPRRTVARSGQPGRQGQSGRGGYAGQRGRGGYAGQRGRGGSDGQQVREFQDEAPEAPAPPPLPRPAHAPAPAQEPVPTLTASERLHRLARQPETLRDVIILREVLDRPVSMRRR